MNYQVIEMMNYLTTKMGVDVPKLVVGMGSVGEKVGLGEDGARMALNALAIPTILATIGHLVDSSRNVDGRWIDQHAGFSIGGLVGILIDLGIFSVPMS